MLLKSRSDEEFALGDIALRHEVSDADFADGDEDFDETTNIDETPDPVIADEDDAEDYAELDGVDEFLPMDYDVDDGTAFEQGGPRLLDDVDADSDAGLETDVSPDHNA